MWTYDDEFSFLFLNLSKILKNTECIWHIERVQIDAIKLSLNWMQILSFSDVFTAVVVVVA